MWNNRSKVQWVGGKKPKVPPPYTPEVKLSETIYDDWTRNLIVGNLWFTQVALIPESMYSTNYYKDLYIIHEYEYLVLASWGNTVHTIPSLSPAIYSGTVRVEEDTRTSGFTRLLRHTFIINGTRYMTRNLGDFIPAEFVNQK